jgi:LPXTG-site transpeptidase (sortase) family protein
VAPITNKNSYILLCTAIFLIGLVVYAKPVLAEIAIPTTDRTPNSPLLNPDPATINSRYLSGFGLDNTFSLFFENRAESGPVLLAWPPVNWEDPPAPGPPALPPSVNASRINYNSTTNGPIGLGATSTRTTVTPIGGGATLGLYDTHIVVKDWPITIGGTTYAFRAWGSVGNNRYHNFYVSNNRTDWFLVNTFVIRNHTNLTGNPNFRIGYVYYNFHDVIELNGTYYGFAETNRGQTVIVRNTDGGSAQAGSSYWEAFDLIGGGGAGGAAAGDLPLYLPAGGRGPTPTGSFAPINIGGSRYYAKISIPGDESGIFLAINQSARPDMPPAALQAAFINPANWEWYGGANASGAPTNPLLSSTAGSGSGHDWREIWIVPKSDLDADWVMFYTADYDSGGGLGGRAIGCLGSILDPADPTTACMVHPLAESDTNQEASSPAGDGGFDADFSLPMTGFEPGNFTSLPSQPDMRAHKDLGDIWLEIPSLEVHGTIIGIPLTEYGWDVTWLSNQIGYLESTAFPTWAGTTALSGHHYLPNGKPGPFEKLDTLQFGDRIFIHAWGLQHVYEVRDVQWVSPNDLSVLKHDEHDWITLITCKGYDEDVDAYKWRVVVQAVLVTIEQEN